MANKIAVIARHSNSFASGLEVFMQRLEIVSNESQLSTFLHLFGNSVPLRFRAGAAIRVQPTFTSRRKPGITEAIGEHSMGYQQH